MAEEATSIFTPTPQPAQLGLELRARLSYAPEQFLKHAGVRSAWDGACRALQVAGFRSLLLRGAPRSGKTHFLLAIMAMLTGALPHFVEGRAFAQWWKERDQKAGEGGPELIIIDDLDNYLAKVTPGESGLFVHFIEALRQRGGAVIASVSSTVEDLPSDDHVKSRLRAALLFEVRPPAEEEIGLLLATLAHQRGIDLQIHHREFLSRRLPRTVAGLEEYLARLDRLARVTGRGIKRQVVADAV